MPKHGDHGHHHHHDESALVPTGHGSAKLSIFENGDPAVFRLAFIGEKRTLNDFALETLRDDGSKQIFAFAPKGDFFESTSEIPEPHEFDALLTFSHSGHEHTARVEFREGKPPHVEGDDHEYQDAHERAHAIEIAQRFAGRTVTTPQIMLFGITGGLMPCPAAFSVLLICLQLKRIALGFTLVCSFSVGLALTMVATGALAAWSVHHAQQKSVVSARRCARPPTFPASCWSPLPATWRGMAGGHCEATRPPCRFALEPPGCPQGEIG